MEIHFFSFFFPITRLKKQSIEHTAPNYVTGNGLNSRQPIRPVEDSEPRRKSFGDAEPSIRNCAGLPVKSHIPRIKGNTTFGADRIMLSRCGAGAVSGKKQKEYRREPEHQ